jgi:hypothetical protein
MWLRLNTDARRAYERQSQPDFPVAPFRVLIGVRPARMCHER